jgi:hypothetical protein
MARHPGIPQPRLSKVLRLAISNFFLIAGAGKDCCYIGVSLAGVQNMDDKGRILITNNSSTNSKTFAVEAKPKPFRNLLDQIGPAKSIDINAQWAVHAAQDQRHFPNHRFDCLLRDTDYFIGRRGTLVSLALLLSQP